MDDVSCKKSRRVTSYGGIIRIRLKGRSLMTSSQPALQAPLYLFSTHYTSAVLKMQDLSERDERCEKRKKLVAGDCRLRRAVASLQYRSRSFQVCTQKQIEAQRSGFDLERSCDKMSER